MKISEVTTELLINYCNAYEEDSTLLTIFKDASISHIKAYTGLDEEKINKLDDLTIALLVLVNSMFDSRGIECDKGKCNSILDSILGLHSNNLI